MIRFEHPRPGTELDWLAVDERGHLGLFATAGYGPVPLSVVANLELVERGVAKLSSLSVVGDALEVAVVGDISSWVGPARSGIYGYDWGPIASEPFARMARPSHPIVIGEVNDRDLAAAALMVRLSLDLEASSRIRVTDLKVPLYGEPLRKPSPQVREKYFERRQIKEAIAFAEAGGIAIHRNFDSYHGSTVRGFRREKPFLHVIALRPVLEEWGRLHGLRPEWIQPEKRRAVAHYDVFGPAAEALIEKLKAPLDSE